MCSTRYLNLNLLIAFFGSIQDIAIDAFRIELVEIEEQGNLAASYQFGYRMAILVASSGALILASRTSWTFVYQLMSLFMFLGLLEMLEIQVGVVDWGVGCALVVVLVC